MLAFYVILSKLCEEVKKEEVMSSAVLLFNFITVPQETPVKEIIILMKSHLISSAHVAFFLGFSTKPPPPTIFIKSSTHLREK